MAIGPLYPCSKPFSTGPHNETVKKLTLFSAIINRINRIEHCITFATLTIVGGKFRNLIDTIGISELGPKKDQVFQSNVVSLCSLKRHHQVEGA